MKKFLLFPMLVATVVTVAQSKYRNPGMETIQAIPWIADTTLADAVAQKSVVPRMKEHVLLYQVEELKNGIHKLNVVYRNPNKEDSAIIFHLANVEAYDKTGAVHVVQHLLIFEAPVVDGESVPTNDIVAGKRGTKIEELKLEEGQWTLTNKNGMFNGNIAKLR